MDLTYLDDDVIDDLLRCPKLIVNPRARWKEQKSSRHRTFQARSECDTHQFRVYVRQNCLFEASFSCGISVEIDGGQSVTLARYNGSDHVHGNPIEGTTISYECHIHKATRRYISAGYKPEMYADETIRYQNLRGAVEAMAQDCNLKGLPLTGLEAMDDLFPEGDHEQF